LAAVNEVDVSADLVPPPPEFAAPPPGHPGYRGGQTITQMHALTQQRQQQLQQMRREQILRHTVSAMGAHGSQPPPIPSQPPPATLPHLCPNKEQIRIISPTPAGQSSQISGHQTHTAQHYPRVHNQVSYKTIDQPLDKNCVQFYDSFANHNSLYY
jgi:hypothetical protein